jgi:hypothetical protein
VKDNKNHKYPQEQEQKQKQKTKTFLPSPEEFPAANQAINKQNKQKHSPPLPFHLQALSHAYLFFS